MFSSCSVAGEKLTVLAGVKRLELDRIAIKVLKKTMFIIYKPVFSGVLSGCTFRFTFLMNRSTKTRGERKTGPAPSYKVLPEVYARMARLGAWGEWLRAGNCWHEALTLGWGFIWFWIPISNSKAISCNLWPIWCSRWLRDHHQGITGSQHVNARSIVWNL